MCVRGRYRRMIQRSLLLVHEFIEICNRKGFKKIIGLYRYGSFTASMLMVELLHVLKIAPGRLWKSCRNITQNTMHLIFVIIAP